MRVPQHDAPVQRLQPGQLGLQLLVIGLPQRGAAPVNLFIIRQVVGGVDRCLVKGVDRAQAGRVLARIEIFIVRRAARSYRMSWQSS